MSYSNDSKPSGSNTNDSNLNTVRWSDSLFTWASALAKWGQANPYSGDAEPIGIVDSYTTSNTTQDIRGGGSFPRSGAGQSFTATKSILYSCQFKISKTGSPSACYAELYAHSGTYGTSSIPTGTALATSANIDLTTVTASLAFVPFLFTGTNAFNFVEGTKYCIVCRHTGGDGSNKINIALDTSVHTASGNESLYNPGTLTWAAVANQDIPFYVYAYGASPYTNDAEGA